MPYFVHFISYGGKLSSQECRPSNLEEDITDISLSIEQDYYDDDGFMTDDGSIESLPFDDDNDVGVNGVEDMCRYCIHLN